MQPTVPGLPLQQQTEKNDGENQSEDVTRETRGPSPFTPYRDRRHRREGQGQVKRIAGPVGVCGCAHDVEATQRIEASAPRIVDIHTEPSMPSLDRSLERGVHHGEWSADMQGEVPNQVRCEDSR